MKKLLMTSVALSVLAAAPAAMANPKNNFSPNGTAAVDTVQSINDSNASSGNITGTNNSSETVPAPAPPPPTPGGALAGASLIEGVFGGQSNDADSTAIQANINESLNTEYLYNEDVGNTDTYVSDYTSTTDKTSTVERSNASAIGHSASANNDSEATYTSTKTKTKSDVLVEDISSASTNRGAAANNGGQATTTITKTNEADYSSASAGGSGGVYSAESNGKGRRGGAGSAAANNGGEATVNNSRLDNSVNDYSKAVASNGSAAANNGASASFSATMSGNQTSASGSGLAIFASFGNDAVVSNASLQSQVTGTSYSLTFIPAPPADDDEDPGTPGGASLASAEGSGGNDYSLSTGENAFQNFAGLQALNLNTGSNASQNANVSVSVASGSISVGTTVTGGGGG